MAEQNGKAQVKNTFYLPKELIEKEVCGQLCKFKVMSGARFMRISREASDGGKLNQEKYAETLLKEVLVEPKITADEITPGALVEIVAEIELLHGAGEETAKKLKKRLEEISPSS